MLISWLGLWNIASGSDISFIRKQHHLRNPTADELQGMTCHVGLWNRALQNLNKKKQQPSVRTLLMDTVAVATGKEPYAPVGHGTTIVHVSSWLAGCLAAWLPGCLTNCLPSCLTACPAGCLPHVCVTWDRSCNHVRRIIVPSCWRSLTKSFVLIPILRVLVEGPYSLTCMLSCHDHHNLLHHSPLLKKTCVRQVVLDKRFPLILSYRQSSARALG